jgi:LmbE family N-acetylglucosaminyl deacetylase
MIHGKNRTILVVAAHPDDELLGCGGSVARFVKEGHKVFSLILGEGITSRDTVRNPQLRKNDLSDLKKNAQSANQLLGVSEVFLENFPDNRFDSVALLDLVKCIESYKEKLQPDVVLTHFENDLNIDHSLTFRAVLTATRPLPQEKVQQVFAFETLSSTEYRYPLTFSPDTFVDISQTVKIKQQAMACYTSELCEYPHPRSLMMIEQNASYWGVRVGLSHAEAFVTIRNIS